jgi:hypothetical protein
MANDRAAGWGGWPVLVHSARTAVAVLVSLLVARLFRLLEAYWAPITTFVITQSSLGAALTVSWQRFIGTALGAVVGAAAANYTGPRVLTFTVSVFLLGLLCALLGSGRSAYRFWGHYGSDCAVDTAARLSMASRLSPFRRSIDRNCCSTDPDGFVAGDRRRDIEQQVTFTPSGPNASL